MEPKLYVASVVRDDGRLVAAAFREAGEVVSAAIITDREDGPLQRFRLCPK